MVNASDKVLKWLAVAGGIILADFFYFPVGLRYFPSSANSKMIMAVVAIIILIVTRASRRESVINKKFILLCLFALGVSLTTYMSTVLNNTHDYTYVSYIISMLVWLGGAYTFVWYVKWVHGKATIRNVTLYLMAVCAAQCVLAVLFDRYPVVESWIIRLFPAQAGLSDYAKEGGRLYGLACAVDVAGMRFAAVLYAMSYISVRLIGGEKESPWMKSAFIICFGIIAVIGNMISRTTIVGVAFGLVYFLYAMSPFSRLEEQRKRAAMQWMASLLLVAVPSVIWLYNNDENFHRRLRFGFEGFFSLAETGEWNVKSNNQLKGMIILPDNIKTWIIGDGIFGNTSNEPYYVGQHYKWFYKDTDVGYSRFLFYSGFFGLGAFILFMIYSAWLCCDEFPRKKILFIGLFIMQLVIWIKVSSDIFLIFAVYISCGMIRDGYYGDMDDNEEEGFELRPSA